jgi:hypothetical protein
MGWRGNTGGSTLNDNNKKDTSSYETRENGDRIAQM